MKRASQYQLVTVAQLIVIATLAASQIRFLVEMAGVLAVLLVTYKVGCAYMKFLIDQAVLNQTSFSNRYYAEVFKQQIIIPPIKDSPAARGENLLQQILTLEQAYDRQTTGCFVAGHYKGKPITIGPGGLLWLDNERYCTAPHGNLVPADVTIAQVLHARTNPQYLFAHANRQGVSLLTPDEMRRLYKKVYSTSRLGNKTMRNALQ